MNKFEEDFVYTYPTQPLFWNIYINDCLCLWTGTKPCLDQFITYLNGCGRNIKFISESSQLAVDFLDTRVFIVDNTLQTEMYNKPTGSHNYLLYTSVHP